MLSGYLRDTDPTAMDHFLEVASWIVIILTFPFSMLVCFKVVAEYERAVIFKLGRLKKGEIVLTRHVLSRFMENQEVHWALVFILSFPALSMLRWWI